MNEIKTREPKVTTRDSLLNRTMQNLREAWREVADWHEGLLSSSNNPNLPDKDAEVLRLKMRDCLEARGGEVSARARAANLGQIYLALNAEGRKRFLKILASEFDIDRDAVNDAVNGLKKVSSLEERAKYESILRHNLQPPRVRLLAQLNALPEGFHFLVDLRAELLKWRKNDPDLASLEKDLLSLLTSWFDVGFLELKRITWHSPASLLEKMIVYEAVHPIKSWDDLKNRLSADRRCFAFFHPRMANEPLIIVQVALVNGIADNIHTLLDESAPVLDPNEADTAIFYSISNAHEGLSGISFGNFLIKKVVDELTLEFRNLKTFATLSPIPGFCSWLESVLPETEGRRAIEMEVLVPVDKKFLSTSSQKITSSIKDLESLLLIPNWYLNPDLAKSLKNPLQRLCAFYLIKEKREKGLAYDRVAHFHLSNGARIERINWLADTSKKGMNQSAGMMVNYLYKLNDIENNHEVYRGEGKVTVSSSIKSLIKLNN